jgi:hypothetical protein
LLRKISYSAIADHCYPQELIKVPKTSHIQIIYSLLGLKDFSRFLWPSDLLQSLAVEIILPTKAPGGYGDHIRNFCWLGDKGGVWQVTWHFQTVTEKAGPWLTLPFMVSNAWGG